MTMRQAQNMYPSIYGKPTAEVPAGINTSAASFKAFAAAADAEGLSPAARAKILAAHKASLAEDAEDEGGEDDE
jgi:hypothetical protein